MNPLATDITGAILAVDDDRDDVDVLRIMLRKTGLPNPVQVYRNGEAAISGLKKWVQNSVKAIRPLLCFLDIRMPDVNGHEVLRWIRGQPALDRVPVVVLSVSEHPRDIQQAAQEGAQCYLAKYPQPAVLKEVLADATRFAEGVPAQECFCMPANLLLVRCRRLVESRAARMKPPLPQIAPGEPLP
jgi:CheY-like chemotaxis protein